MPELAYAYACGKAVMRDAERIFPGIRVAWHREIDIGLGGPSDLVFQMPNGCRIIVEFKMRDKVEKYLADVRKLTRSKEKQDARLFCVLLDPFTNRLADSRIEQIKATADCDMIPLLKPFPHFPTKQDWYSGEISCLVAVWSVGHPPNGECSGDAQLTLAADAPQAARR